MPSSPMTARILESKINYRNSKKRMINDKDSMFMTRWVARCESSRSIFRVEWDLKKSSRCVIDFGPFFLFSLVSNSCDRPNQSDCHRVWLSPLHRVGVCITESRKKRSVCIEWSEAEEEKKKNPSIHFSAYTQRNNKTASNKRYCVCNGKQEGKQKRREKNAACTRSLCSEKRRKKKRERERAAHTAKQRHSTWRSFRFAFC